VKELRPAAGVYSLLITRDFFSVTSPGDKMDEINFDQGRNMNSETDPIVDNWYQHPDKGQAFRVVAVDEAEGWVEIQYFDGNVEELDLDSWLRLELQPIEAPENWSGPMDAAEMDDLTGTEISDTSPGDWAEPLDEIVKPRDLSAEEPAEEGEDGWGEGYPEEEPLEQEPATEEPEESKEEKPQKRSGDEAWSVD
jgi:hypothetical protein